MNWLSPVPLNRVKGRKPHLTMEVAIIATPEQLDALAGNVELVLREAALAEGWYRVLIETRREQAFADECRALGITISEV